MPGLQELMKMFNRIAVVTGLAVAVCLATAPAIAGKPQYLVFQIFSGGPDPRNGVFVNSTTKSGYLAAANRIAADAASGVAFHQATSLARIERPAGESRFAITLAGDLQGTFEFDNIVANVGYRPDNRIFEELQVHECYASQGPMKLAAALLGASSGDCLDQTSQGPGALLNPEPNFYILGAKSYGRNPDFLLSIGLQQVRDLFTIIGDRADLDLYKTAPGLGIRD